jgi:hypothetical protein
MITLFDDVMLIENQEASHEDYHDAIQRCINAGNWSMQGSHGRAMMSAIEAGECLLGHNPARDYYGSLIPSRDQVKQGTKGSFDYVVERIGIELATHRSKL